MYSSPAPLCSFDLVRPLGQYTDRELLEKLSSEPNCGRYLVALFCRYGTLLSRLLSRTFPQPHHQLHYCNHLWWQLYKTWSSASDVSYLEVPLDLWIATQFPKILPLLPAPQSSAVVPRSPAQPLSPPLWCYLQKALTYLPKDSRFLLVFSDVFQWDLSEILAQLEIEGITLSYEDLYLLVHRSRKRLLELLPQDILPLYSAS